jgi:purine-binding chemotaxis protein CheW
MIQPKRPAGRKPAPKEAPDDESAPSKKDRSILKSRAEELAAEHLEDRIDENALEVLEFILASERYAIESVHIREVCPMREFTQIPGTPSFVLGLINIRGQILSVIDIRRFFDLPVKGLSDLNRVMVIQTPRMELGILADRIVGVLYVPQSDLQPALPTMTGIRSEYLRGITREGLVVLDVQKMVADPKILVNEEVE